MSLRGLLRDTPGQQGRRVEVEARFSVEADALEVLYSCGISFGEPVHQDDQAYAPREWRYGDNRIGVPFARLRTQLDRHLFTVKRPITDVRTCVESECEVDDRYAMHQALELMGFAPTVRIVKSRRVAELAGLTFCFDELEGVGTFVEVEAIVDADENLDDIRGQLEGLLDEMGVAARRCLLSYDTLVYEAARGLPDAV